MTRLRKLSATFVAILLLVGLPAVSYYYLKRGEQHRMMRKVRPFEFRNVWGGSISEADLSGNVYLAAFLYTRCGLPCDRLAGAQALMQSRFAESPFRCITLTIDPEHDDLESLRGYAGKFGADPARWYFLRGSRREVIDQVLGGFYGKVSNPGGSLEKMEADPKLVLVNQAGYIRGYFKVETPENLAKLEEAVRAALETETED